MRISARLTAIALVVLSLGGSNINPISSATRSLALPAILSVPRAIAGGFALQSVTGPGAIKFSSAYTDLTKCGSGMTKKEEQEAEERGTDIPTKCKGYGGYHIYISYSACSSDFSVDKGEESIRLGMQAGDWKQKSVEWRMANGQPFAIIMRVYEYAGDELCATGGKITSESLMIRGLKGFEHIDEEVKVKGTPNPNAKARQIADKGYAGPRRA